MESEGNGESQLSLEELEELSELPVTSFQTKFKQVVTTAVAHWKTWFPLENEAKSNYLDTLLSLAMSQPELPATTRAQLQSLLPAEGKYYLRVQYLDPLIYSLRLVSLETSHPNILDTLLVKHPFYQQLEHLSLRGAGLSEDSFKLAWLPRQLTRLDLSFNHFRRDVLGERMQRLHFLDYRYNYLRAIILYCSESCNFRLSYNRLEAVKLQGEGKCILVLDHNRLKRFTVPVSVVKVDVSYNPL